ncbi:MAG: hypothetical protein MUF18_05700 [Fimbriiglobus sp.]|jgi:hypothetical protein|nr:hypothetical protein [Fimbriiglobus sp.]
MTPPFTTTGTLTDATTLTLDSPAPVGGRVRVTLEAVAEPDPLNLLEFFEQLERDQAARGHVPLTREEIDAHMREERAGWDHRP